MRLAVQSVPPYVIAEHEWEVPLDHDRPERERITVFAREVVRADKQDASLPWLVYLQGGPGHEATRVDWTTLWVSRATRDYRLLLLDQRGTGRSTRVDRASLEARGDARAQADYLAHFRADAIVRDAEAVRADLTGGERWAILGQSYGGFCALTYLSFAPGGLREALITGGVPPIFHGPDAVYRATYRRVAGKNRRYYERYPKDAARVRAIAERLASDDIRLPDGTRLTPRRFRSAGIAFGISTGFEKLHYLVETASHDGRLPFATLRDIGAAEGFDRNPIYALLHEAIYCQGEASHWSADRVLAELPEFADDADPLLFTGEMVYRGTFEELAELRPLLHAAELLAEKDDWPALYDVHTLRRNEVPVAAAVYADDMYVERAFSEETAEAVRGTRVWLTSEYEHDGLGVDERVLGRLVDMVRGAV